MVRGGINNGGEVCRWGEGMFVDEDVEDEFLNKVTWKMKRLSVGDGFDEKRD